MDKKEIRKRILAVRDAISIEDRAGFDTEIRKRILTCTAYQEAQIILAYASYRSEVDTMTLIRQALSDGKLVFAPKVSGDEMEFWRITAMEDLQKGYRGIPEPIESVSFPEWIITQQNNVGEMHKNNDICLIPETAMDTKAYRDGSKMIYPVMMWMPGVVFDKERHRIGYGKGFYDRYLDRLTDLEREICCRYCIEVNLTTAALAYGCQVLEQIPFEPHDIKPDMLITEEID